MYALNGLLPVDFSFPATQQAQAVSGQQHPLDMPQTTATSGCRPWIATINPAPPQSPNTQFSGVAAVSASDVWAVGFTVQPPDEDAPALTLIEHWDGQSWQIITSPSPHPAGGNALSSVAAVSASDVWAVGFTGETPGARGFGTGQTLIEHWDGTGWQVIPSPSPGSVSSPLTAVAVVQADDVWAAGRFSNTTDPSGPLSTLIEHWDGHKWQVVPSPNPESSSTINGLAVVSANDIWAVGFSSPSLSTGPFHTLTEHWDGKTWRGVSSPRPPPTVNRLVSVTVVPTPQVRGLRSVAHT